MPKDTFFRLPQEKQERIFQAAVQEFSSVTFTEASINRMIRTAGIPRGSFYQYFDGKEDLFQYVLLRMSQEKKEIFAPYRKTAPSGFLETLRQAAPAIFQWADDRPQYYRLGYQITRDKSPFIRSMMAQLGDQYGWMRQLLEADRKAGRIRPDVELDVVIDLYFSMANRLLEMFYEKSRRETLAYFGQMMEILQFGICPPREARAEDDGQGQKSEDPVREGENR